ncbi:PRD domain-containing protein [Vagococcus silagei]|uniref:PRD domain-containing protein n=1 Tax=Vagococcus silagei TaxID=2508885 RepID=A0A4S3B3T8_9ENTE|nr:PRD domain-containing protein [Vagococcus silagei]THB60917.1 PRD domain-containing protein [Vagococcus silagei]
MKIRQILNNNIALVDRGGNEIIVYSKGISFLKKVGQPITEAEIEKVYVLDSEDRLEHFSYLLQATDEQLIEIVNQLVTFGKTKLNTTLNDYIYLALVDHLSFAIDRSKKEQFISSPLTWNVKKFYSKHFEIGMYGLDLLHKQYAIEFPEDEAVSIALHFINQQFDEAVLTQTNSDLKTLKHILNIIKYHFNIEFDETSLNYSRLITHLQFFIERLHRKENYQEESSVLFEQVKTLYPDAFEAVQKIAIYVLGKYDQELTQDEYTYLMLHVHRVVQRRD